MADKQVSAGAARSALPGVCSRTAASRRSSPASSVAEADELGGIVDRAIADNADAVEKIRAGKDQAIGALVGAVMRETKGRADGGEVQRLIRERIDCLAPSPGPARNATRRCRGA